MPTDAASRRRGRPETALAIERAAVDLVLAQGYENVTVDMICEAASVSQRTFFNYFKTKDAALLGSAAPSVDEERAERFVLSTGPILAEAVGLVRIDPAMIAMTEPLFGDRIRAIASHPELLARQMERFAAIETELRVIIRRRLEREVTDAGRGDEPGSRDADLDAEAEVTTQLLGGLLRFVGQNLARAMEAGAPPPSDDELTRLLASVLPKLT
ncbi:TetR/AcrR family transcriptional regulator [Rathayibacter sp. YIM 133350]|uniref:TetR/AcrR family transcriptional regulator n=1 Tax=Rathayibacter sp. YIM 133350 TaxID=3131992 RepID=UPI00307F61D1